MVGDLISAGYLFVDYIFTLFVMLWPLLLILFAWRLGAVVGMQYGDLAIGGFNRRQRLKKLGIDATDTEIIHKIRTLHPREFEFYVADLLAKNGFKVKVVGNFGKPDGGIDIVARRESIHYLVQCKKFIDRDIGVKYVRELYGIGADQAHSKGAKMILVGTTYFTDSAKKFAKKKNIQLIDADRLIELVTGQERKGMNVGLGEKSRGELLRNVPPACPVCTKDLVWRKGPYGDFIGCKGYPACRYSYSKPADNQATTSN